MICYIDLTSMFVLSFMDHDQELIYKHIDHKPFLYKNLPEIFQDSLKLLRKVVKDVKKIIVVSGPGSFTGIRVSIAFAKGLSFANSIPIYLVSSLKVLSYLFKNPSSDFACLNANKGYFYVGYFNQKEFKEEIWEESKKILEEKKSQFLTINDLKEFYPFKKVLEDILNIPFMPSDVIKPNYIQLPSVSKPKIKLNYLT